MPGLEGMPPIEGHSVVGTSISNATQNSHEFCSHICSLFNFRYFAVQFGKQCFCDNSYGGMGAGLESECSFGCPGNSNQKCGGFDRNSVFKLNYANVDEYFQGQINRNSTLNYVTSPNAPADRTFIARSLLQCASKCSSTAGCQAVIFAKQRKLCRLLGAVEGLPTLVGTDELVFIRG
uniref:WSC domain-containing protein n=1 Tax=Macrostomum lignano TaxID=282301 RepID=A0A1I8I316_9PLAT